MSDDRSLILTGRRALVTALVSIALNPISIFLGYYLGQTLQRPKLSVEVVDVKVREAALEVAPAVLKSIAGNLTLATLLKDRLDYECRDWIDNGRIMPGFLESSGNAIDSVAKIIDFESGLIGGNIKAIEDWKPGAQLVVTPMSSAISPEPIQVVARRDKGAALDVLTSYLASLKQRKSEIDDLRNELTRLGSLKETARTGEVDFELGILNSGDSDGVVPPDAELKFGDSILKLARPTAKRYAVVKAHSFETIVYNVDESQTKKGDIEKWAATVKRRQQEGFRITVSASRQRLTAVGRLPP